MNKVRGWALRAVVVQAGTETGRIGRQLCRRTWHMESDVEVHNTGTLWGITCLQSELHPYWPSPLQTGMQSPLPFQAAMLLGLCMFCVFFPGHPTLHHTGKEALPSFQNALGRNLWYPCSPWIIIRLHQCRAVLSTSPWLQIQHY